MRAQASRRVASGSVSRSTLRYSCMHFSEVVDLQIEASMAVRIRVGVQQLLEVRNGRSSTLLSGS